MTKKKENEKKKDYPSLLDAFDLGDRVKRVYKDKNGRNKEYREIILAIDDQSIEVYWDTRDGKYRPDDMRIAFTNCLITEIYRGNEEYTPIKKEH